MSIQSDVKELNDINMEIKRLNYRARQLRQRKKFLEENIAEFLKSKDQPGVKYHNTAIILENKEKRGYKKEKDKDVDALEVLRKHGIKYPEEVLGDLLEARKGEKIETSKLKIQKIKKKKGN